MKLGERGEEGTASRRLFGGLRDSSLYTLSVEPREVGVIKLETHFSVWRRLRSECGQTSGLIFDYATLFRTHSDLQGLHLLTDVIGDKVGSSVPQMVFHEVYISID